MGLQGKSSCFMLAVMTLLSFNMCFLEEVAAQPHSHESAHHEDSVQPADSHAHADDANHAHESKKSEDPCNSGDVVCCENVVAVQPSMFSALSKPILIENLFLVPTLYQIETSIKHPPQYDYQIDFSPGSSPPSVFLFSNTNHAPPLHV